MYTSYQGGGFYARCLNPHPRTHTHTHIHLGRRQGEGRERKGGQRRLRAQVRVDGAAGGAGAPLPHQLPVRNGELVVILCFGSAPGWTACLFFPSSQPDNLSIYIIHKITQIKCPHHHHPAASSSATATTPAKASGGSSGSGSSSPEEEQQQEEQAEAGCQFTGWRRRVMGEHASQCRHRPVGCSLACGWKGKKLEEVRFVVGF